MTVKNVFDFVNDLSNDKQYHFDSTTKSKYDSFMVNRAMSQHADIIMYANEMNKMPWLSKLMQHDFYFHALVPKKRYGKWAKAGVDNEELVELIIKDYKVNRVHAKQYLDLMSKEEMKALKLKYEVGGRKSK